MTPWCNQFITDGDRELFEKIRKVVMRFPDVDLGWDEKGSPVVLSCHMIVRAIAKVFHLKYMDGHFHPKFEHSWLITPGGHVIDVYPVRILGGPFLMVGGKEAGITHHFYKPRSAKWIGSGRFSKPSFRRSVKRLVREISRMEPYYPRHEQLKLDLKL